MSFYEDRHSSIALRKSEASFLFLLAKGMNRLKLIKACRRDKIIHGIE